MLQNNPYNLQVNLDINEANIKFIPVSIIINSKSVIFATDFSVVSFAKTHSNYDYAKEIALEYLEEESIPLEVYEKLVEFNNIKTQLISWSNDRLSIQGNSVLFDNEPVPAELENHLINLFKEDPENKTNSLTAWTNFIAKLGDAMNLDTHNRLFAFLRYNDLSIDQDGDVLAWKVVRNDYKDIYSGTIDNSVGAEPSMPRTKVNFDPTQTCSYGLHACSFGYLSSFGSVGNPVMILKIDVRDIVSVPVDYDGRKIRVCRYKVVGQAGVWGETINKDTNVTNILSKILRTNV